MTKDEYAKLGESIINNLNKLISGEHPGSAFIVPILVQGGPGMTSIRIEMPSLGKSILKFRENGDSYMEFLHYTWVPDSQAYVLDDFVYKEKKALKSRK